MEKRPTPLIAAVLALAVAGLGVPAPVTAQACLGNTAASGQGFASGGAAFTDGAWALNGTLGANTQSPLAVQADVTHTMLDDSEIATTALSATGAADVTGSDLSVCPAASLGYQWLSDEGELSGFDVSADGVILGGGLAVGGDVASDASEVRFIPRGSISVVHDRATVEVAGVSTTESDTYGAFAAGMVLGGSSVYGGPGVSITTQEDSDPVFSVRLGVAF
jgi:hypothetical protein